jgi:hypothetical protein
MTFSIQRSAFDLSIHSTFGIRHPALVIGAPHAQFINAALSLSFVIRYSSFVID